MALQGRREGRPLKHPLGGGAQLEGLTGEYFDKNAIDTAWTESFLDERNRSAVWKLCDRTVTAS
ncbi:hypothetical protein ACFV9C_43315 [Kribbella sp. NPDC059898]|uniref:hypothetical protein n=1 Tax=Kribbella sp. NPDC059898 TaxID=3346995 RepID=UPI003646EF08